MEEGAATATAAQQQDQQQNPDEEAQLQQLQSQHLQYLSWIQQYVVAQAGGEASTSEEINAQITDVPHIVGALYNASSAHSYLSALKYWADAVRELERMQRELAPCTSPSPALDGWPSAFAPTTTTTSISVKADAQAYSEAVHKSIEALKAAMYAGELSAYYAHAGVCGGQPCMQAVCTHTRMRARARAHTHTRKLPSSRAYMVYVCTQRMHAHTMLLLHAGVYAAPQLASIATAIESRMHSCRCV